MPEVPVKARISEDHLRALQAEARRQGVPVETLVQHTVNCLLRELEREQEQCLETATS
jgi:hypothetical protein